ncbi:MAG: VanZ family protein [Inhella sp.]
MPLFTWRLLCALLTLLVSWLALSPAPPDLASTGWDKANHAFAFAALSFVSGQGWPRAARWRHGAAWLAYGLLIELLQTQLPPRQGEAADWLADAIGIGLGLGLSALLKKLSGRARAG